ncbi:MAG: cation:proton antiporter [Microbacterium sp. SCN 70-18]|nr:MAG: cation:proton antiporter [Microbacterium sp. SCN 70-18]
MLWASLILVGATCAVAAPVARAAGRAAGWWLALPLVVAAGMLAALGSGSVWVPWMPTLGVGFGLRLDGLSLLFSLIVLVIGALVLIYSARYLPRGPNASFFVLMTGFAAAMLLLVLADDLVLMFVAWEATTLCSFFLIARSGKDAREPAIRTLLVTAAGGLSLLAAVVVMWVGTGTTRITDVLMSDAWAQPGFAIPVALLLAGAVFTKSAQFPFQAWLPDSMVAITPVSAYLHAAAMVKAGIYLALLFSPALAGELVWSSLLITSGLITAVFGAVTALRETDLKALLAYSTISQLGLLVAMIGVGTPEALTAAVVHTVAHALFKAALFMLIGVIDHEAGTRDIRELAKLRIRMPITIGALALAAASMAGIPPLLGFVSKESMFAAFVEAPGPVWFPVVLTVVGALTAVFTFAYSGRIVVGALGGRNPSRTVAEAPALFWGAPGLLAAAGLVLGVLPFLLDDLVAGAATSAVGAPVDAYLELWHGFNLPLAVSAAVIALGTAMVVGRARVERVTDRLRSPVSGLAVVDATRAGIIRVGGLVGRTTGTTKPALHLGIPVAVLVVIAAVGVFTVPRLPEVVGDPTEPIDWLLLALIAAGTIAAVRARTRIAAVVVTGVVGTSMTVWFFVLGAADVAMTQLLVEILTVCVMVLLLRRLPREFMPSRAKRRRILPAALALCAGAATTLGVWALTGRREMSPAAEFYLSEGQTITGGANIVNTILVDFRAFDTLGELTVLGVAGIAISALLYSRRPTPVRSSRLLRGTPLSDAAHNSVFVRTVARVLVPAIVILSVVLLVRGHQEPGGGFIAALIGGAGFALLYLAAPSESAARIRWPFLALIGAGIVVGTGTGLLGYFDGSFLRPLSIDILGTKLTTALVFDVGVYLAVVGVVLTALNLLGRQHHTEREEGGSQPDPKPDRNPKSDRASRKVASR